MLRSQVLLIALLAGLALYLFRLRTTPRDRLMYVVMVGLAVPLVLFPDASNVVAHTLGIGRGADFVFYQRDLFTVNVRSLRLVVKRSGEAFEFNWHFEDHIAAQ